MLKSMKHGYGNLCTVSVPGTAEVRVQSRYHVYPRCTPFFPKKKIPGTGPVRVGYGLGTGQAESSQERRSFPAKIFDSQSLSLPSSLCRHSHILSLPATLHSELQFGLAATENQWVLRFPASFSFYWASFSLSVGLEG